MSIRGCQFGNHGEPFLWQGSGDDDIDTAIMEIIQLAELNRDLALEIADEIGACVSQSKVTAPPPAGQAQEEGER